MIFLQYLLIASIIYFIIVSVKFVRIILVLVVGIIYIPINRLNTQVQKWYFKLRKTDEVSYYLFTPFYWILVAITFIISVPYDFLIAQDIH